MALFEATSSSSIASAASIKACSTSYKYSKEFTNEPSFIVSNASLTKLSQIDSIKNKSTKLFWHNVYQKF